LKSYISPLRIVESQPLNSALCEHALEYAS
jgi:hypothetical protein